MKPNRSLKSLSVKADADAARHRAEVLRRARVVADDGDDGMAYALANLEAAEENAADLRAAVAALKNGQPPRKRKPRRRRKAKSGRPKRKGPTLTAVQDEAIDAVLPGHEMTLRALFDWCEEKRPGVVAGRMPAFASTFSKKFKARDDITLVQKHVGSRPAVYMKRGAPVPP